jgi:hypothetical protein
VSVLREDPGAEDEWPVCETCPYCGYCLPCGDCTCDDMPRDEIMGSAKYAPPVADDAQERPARLGADAPGAHPQ